MAELAAVLAAEKAEQSREHMTFVVALNLYTTAKHSEISSEKYRLQWVSSLNRYAVPVIGDMPVAYITTVHIMNILEPIWSTKTETARNVRGRFENVLGWCEAHGPPCG